jgi:hypothetical protein
MTNSIVDTSQRKAAKIAGIGYLAIIILGIFAEFVIRSKLIVPGDATTTAQNILASEGLFRISIASDLIMLLFDVIVAWALYVILKHFHKSLSLLAAWFRLLHAGIYGITLMTLFFVLLLVSGAGYLTVFGADKLHALVLLFINGHSYGYDLGLVFFAFHCFVLGSLVYKSGYFPRVLGVLMIAASFVYFIGSLIRFLFPGYVTLIQPIYVVAFIAELSFALWLLFKGVKVKSQNEIAN